jgi:broad specificity phosphatase PhoE
VRIGLIRHFPVEEQLPTGWQTAADLQTWRERYERSETSVGKFDVGDVAWQACIASDLPRTRITAHAVFTGDIEFTDLLREAHFAQFNTGNLRLPVWVWKWLIRLTWMMGHRSQRACRDEFHRRVATVADRLCNVECDTLVVSHAGMMAFLSKELRRRGFIGPKLNVANHATVYVYEKRG